jgi:hypothetical protein
MTTLTTDVVDQIRIEQLLGNLGRCLDERDFEGLRELFTENGQVLTPGGEAHGHDALVAQARRRHSDDEGIQHVISNVLATVEGSTAEGRANLVVTFAKTGTDDPAAFRLGEVYAFHLIRAQDHWRIARLEARPVWTQNRPVS